MTNHLRTVVVALAAMGVAEIAAVACSDPVTVCPATLKVSNTIPDTTTIRVGAATIAIAGSVWTGCGSAPLAADYIWKTSDSTIVRVTPIDSTHASILGLRPGLATVGPHFQHDTVGINPSAVRVTVVP